MNATCQTALHALHLELGARMTTYANHRLPLCYKTGIIAEHLHARRNAVLFDVSHMVQVRIGGEDAALGLEQLTPSDILGLAIDSQVYTCLTNVSGGVVDDITISRRDTHVYHLVLNATRREQGLRHLRQYLPAATGVDVLEDNALLALQGPATAGVLNKWVADLDQLSFMHAKPARIGGFDCYISRCGYSGEDGFEISTPNKFAPLLARTLLEDPRVLPAGLGARDSLRLEAGLCLYGHELNEHTTPIEAGLQWVVAPVRRVNGARMGDFLGADIILKQCIKDCPTRRVGCLLSGRVPARSGATLYNEHKQRVGCISSGNFSPILKTPVAMAYVDKEFSLAGTMLQADIRNKMHPLQVASLPLVAHNYYRV